MKDVYKVIKACDLSIGDFVHHSGGKFTRVTDMGVSDDKYAVLYVENHAVLYVESPCYGARRQYRRLKNTLVITNITMVNEYTTKILKHKRKKQIMPTNKVSINDKRVTLKGITFKDLPLMAAFSIANDSCGFVYIKTTESHKYSLLDMINKPAPDIGVEVTQLNIEINIS